VAQHDVDLRRGEQPPQLVERRVQHLERAAAVAQQLGELAPPVVAGEVHARDLVDPGQRPLPVGVIAGAEHAVDVPHGGAPLDGADHGDGLAQQVVRAGLDRAGRVCLDQGAEEDAGPGARAGVDASGLKPISGWPRSM
jgi:hypothetical protein